MSRLLLPDHRHNSIPVEVKQHRDSHRWHPGNGVARATSHGTICWGAHLIEADSICSKHRSKTHTFGAGAQGEILGNKHGSPHTVHSATQIAPQINTQDRHADNHCNANDEPLRQVGVDNCIEHVHEERSMRGFDACSSFELGFGHGERARWPGNQLDDDRVAREAMCIMRRTRRPRVTVQPSNTQTHQSAWRSRTASAATRACSMLLRIVPQPLMQAWRSGCLRLGSPTLRGRTLMRTKGE